MKTPIQHCIINYMGRESKKRTCTPKTKINPPYNILSHSTPIQTTKRECWLSSLQALVTWAAVTSLKPEQAWVPWMDCLGTEEGGEDMPANEPCPIDVVCLFPSAPAHSLQIQAGPPAVKLHLLHPKDVEPLHWKSFEKPPGFTCKDVNIAKHERNANQNFKEVSLHTSHNGHRWKLQTINAGEGVEQREPSYNDAGMEIGSSHCGGHRAVP